MCDGQNIFFSALIWSVQYIIEEEERKKKIKPKGGTLAGFPCCWFGYKVTPQMITLLLLIMSSYTTHQLTQTEGEKDNSTPGGDCSWCSILYQSCT